MRDGGRIAAAIAVLADIETRHRPVRMALKTWGDSARYAGAKDRAFVSGLVLDALRRGAPWPGVWAIRQTAQGFWRRCASAGAGLWSGSPRAPAMTTARGR